MFFLFNITYALFIISVKQKLFFLLLMFKNLYTYYLSCEL